MPVALLQTRADNFFGRFTQSSKENLFSRTQKKLHSVVETAFGIIRMTDQGFAESGSRLKSIDQSLHPTMPAADAEAIVKKTKAEIQYLESSSGIFRDRLQEANQEIDQLKEKWNTVARRP